jgi:hypothetical protein
MTWLLVGLYKSRSVHLSKVAEKIPGSATLPSLTRRVMRFLDNPALRVRTWYEPIAKAIIHNLCHGVIRLIVDGSKVGFGHQLLIVAIAYRKRSIPLAWTWVKGSRGHSSSWKQKALLMYVHGLIPAKTGVILIGDSEFGRVEVLKLLKKWHWEHVLRQKGRNLVKLKGQRNFQRLDSLVNKPGQSRWLPNCQLTAKHSYPVNVLAYWKVGEKEPWLLATNLISQKATLRAYRIRMWIEIVCTQMTKACVFTIGAGWDDIADFNFFVIYDHSINKQFYQLPTLFKIQIIQGWLDTLAKLLDVVCQCQGLNLLFGFMFQLPQLLLETILGSNQFLALSLKFVSHDDFGQIHF